MKRQMMVTCALTLVAFTLPPSAVGAAGDRRPHVDATFPDTLLMQNGGPVINIRKPPLP